MKTMLPLYGKNHLSNEVFGGHFATLHLMSKPILISLIGPPGSGKSYFAERYSHSHGFIHINSDQVRMRYFAHPTFTARERLRVYDKIFDATETEVRRGQNVILDCNLETNAERRSVLSRFEPYAVVLFAVLQTPRDVALERAIHRGYSDDKVYHPTTSERVNEMHENYETIDATLPHITLKGDDEYEVNERRLGGALDSSI